MDRATTNRQVCLSLYFGVLPLCSCVCGSIESILHTDNVKRLPRSLYKASSSVECFFSGRLWHGTSDSVDCDVCSVFSARTWVVIMQLCVALEQCFAVHCLNKCRSQQHARELFIINQHVLIVDINDGLAIVRNQIAYAAQDAVQIRRLDIAAALYVERGKNVAK
jgi:hypothetical protein